MSETDGELNKLAQEAQPDPYPESPTAPADAAKPASAQLELGLDPAAQAPAQKQT